MQVYKSIIMKIFFIILLTSLLFISCTDIIDSEDNFSNYFPLTTGNTWFYNIEEGSVNPAIKSVVEGKTSYNGKEYYVANKIYNYNTPSQTSYKDTLRKTYNGRIYQLIDGKEYLRFDFSLADGAKYKFAGYSLSNNYTYTVTVKKGIKVQIGDLSYNDCTEFFFDIPSFVDDERWYIFAPNIGLIKEFGGEGISLYLDSYSLK